MSSFGSGYVIGVIATLLLSSLIYDDTCLSRSDIQPKCFITDDAREVCIIDGRAVITTKE